MFGKASTTALLDWCRTLKMSLGAGLPIVQVFQSLAERGHPSLRPVAERITAQLKEGSSLSDALEPESFRFPTMFTDLVTVGEKTGNLPEMAGELEHYFRLVSSLRRKFLSKIAWPIFQFCAALGVIALVIIIFGWLNERPGAKPISPIGFGLVGVEGAAIFLLTVIGVIAGVYFVYLFFSRTMCGAASIESSLLRLPMVGGCLTALALFRFCQALRLTLESGMRADQSLKRALNATGNQAFMMHAKRAGKSLREGEDIAGVLRGTGIFPHGFLAIVENAELTGQLPEVMGRQAEHYREEVEFRLNDVTRFVSFGVWLFTAVFIIIAIFKLANIYLGAIDQAGSGI